MPVQDVEFVAAHAIEETFESGDAGEVAAFVEHEAAPTEAGGIDEGDAGNGNGTFLAGTGGDELGERLEAVKMAGLGGGVDDRGFLEDPEDVGFAAWPFDVGWKGVGAEELDGAGDVGGCGFEGESCGSGQG